ncbi:MAG: hypothetical protein MUC96_04685 [Myxococcaceae bacterium]|jgi:hypothetical protein|nr:hypothetical protein [Myxococcaceae bacterium]
MRASRFDEVLKLAPWRHREAHSPEVVERHHVAAAPERLASHVDEALRLTPPSWWSTVMSQPFPENSR